MIALRLTIPLSIGKFRVLGYRVRRLLPQAWSEIPINTRLACVRRLCAMPVHVAQLHNLRDILRLSRRQFAAISPDDIVQCLQYLDFLTLDPTTTPIVSRFLHAGRVYYCPLPDFENGTAQEYALADDYFNEIIADPDNPVPLTRLIATLARPYDAHAAHTTADARQPLSIVPAEVEYDIHRRAAAFADIDYTIATAMLAYWRGVSEAVHRRGIAVGIFEPPKADSKGTRAEGNLFGWWTSYRIIAKMQQKTEEQIWSMSFWRVFAIMMEEKKAQDDLKNQTKNG